MCHKGLLFHSMWNLAGPGIEPMSPALVGRFLIPEPPGKPYTVIFQLDPNSFKSLIKVLNNWANTDFFFFKVKAVLVFIIA